MKKKRITRGEGYTIVEVMIVLAVTGLMFVTVAAFIAGKQSAAEFQTAIQDAKASIEEAINETASGNYPNTDDFTCTGTTSSPPTFSPGGTGQGGNSGCELLGTVFHFSDGSKLPDDQFQLYPIAGSQNTSGVFHNAMPVILAGTSESQDQGAKSISNSGLEYGVHVQSMQYSVGGGNLHDIGSIAFVQSLGVDVNGKAAPGSSPIDGSQTLNLVVPVNSASALSNDLGTEVDDLHNAFNEAVGATYLDTASKPKLTVEICLQSGSTNQSGLLTIGDATSGNGLAVQLQIFGNDSCEAS